MDSLFRACEIIQEVLHLDVEVLELSGKQRFLIGERGFARFPADKVWDFYQESVGQTMKSSRSEYAYRIDRFSGLGAVTTGIWEGEGLVGVLIAGPFSEEPITRTFVNRVRRRAALAMAEDIVLEKLLLSITPPAAAPQVMGQLILTLIRRPMEQAEMVITQNYEGPAVEDVVDYGSMARAIRNISRQYSLESSLREAIRNGERDRAKALFNQLPTDFKYRLPEDVLRAEKNSAIVGATVMRLSAYDGGVAPHQIHEISERYAILIEKAPNVRNIRELTQRLLETYCDAVQAARLSGYSQPVGAAIAYMQLHYADAIDLEQIAGSIPLQKNYLSRIFKAETGGTVIEHLTKIRLEAVKGMLADDAVSITDGCLRAGFGSYAHFSTVFKKHMGMTCHQWREEQRRGT